MSRFFVSLALTALALSAISVANAAVTITVLNVTFVEPGATPTPLIPGAPQGGQVRFSTTSGFEITGGTSAQRVNITYNTVVSCTNASPPSFSSGASFINYPLDGDGELNNMAFGSAGYLMVGGGWQTANATATASVSGGSSNSKSSTPRLFYMGLMTAPPSDPNPPLPPRGGDE